MAPNTCAGKSLFTRNTTIRWFKKEINLQIPNYGASAQAGFVACLCFHGHLARTKIAVLDPEGKWFSRFISDPLDRSLKGINFQKEIVFFFRNIGNCFLKREKGTFHPSQVYLFRTTAFFLPFFKISFLWHKNNFLKGFFLHIWTLFHILPLVYSSSLNYTFFLRNCQLFKRAGLAVCFSRLLKYGWSHDVCPWSDGLYFHNPAAKGVVNLTRRKMDLWFHAWGRVVSHFKMWTLINLLYYWNTVLGCKEIVVQFTFSGTNSQTVTM